MDGIAEWRGTYFKVLGQGIPIVLGYPIMATGTAEDPNSVLAQDYYALLSDRYSVLVMDYPNRAPGVGRSSAFPSSEFTVEAACRDILAVADGAGFQNFIWWGFSWGGLIGVELAIRSKRVSALVCGGWPPFGGPYCALLTAIERAASDPAMRSSTPMDQFVTFYQSIQGQADDERVRHITCPRLAFIGTHDTVEIGGVHLPLSEIVQEKYAELEGNGWCIRQVSGWDHSLYKHPKTVVPIIREFLDAVT